MLTIFNRLKPFFEDCYRRINVREYARIINVSPPTASKILKEFNEKGLLKREDDRIYINYYANKESELFIDLSRIYWKIKLKESGLLDFLEEELLSPVIILFGSLSKAEVNAGSDIDLAVFSPSKKEIFPEKYEKILKRKIQLFVFDKIESIKNKSLKKNILNGYKLRGQF